ncbi:hypothetical protein [Chromobacterium vaccinii]|uniref:hypothetical protein n=1 Tax=Chromobacterium vaccinii TaxID=1108595 RepID=UPI003457B718
MSILTDADLTAAQVMVVRYHQAILASDFTGAGKVRADYRELCTHLSGATLVGSVPGASSSGERLDMALAAEDGVEPLWGQRGRFLVVVDGLPAVVKTLGLSSTWNVFTFYAVEAKAPFIGPSGYRTHYCAPAPGKMPAEQAVDVLRQLIRADLRPMPSLSATTVQQIQTLAALPFVVAMLAHFSDSAAPALQLHLF